jgi:hypothetical protein
VELKVFSLEIAKDEPEARELNEIKVDTLEQLGRV